MSSTVEKTEPAGATAISRSLTGFSPPRPSLYPTASRSRTRSLRTKSVRRHPERLEQARPHPLGERLAAHVLDELPEDGEAVVRVRPLRAGLDLGPQHRRVVAAQVDRRRAGFAARPIVGRTRSVQRRSSPSPPVCVSRWRIVTGSPGPSTRKPRRCSLTGSSSATRPSSTSWTTPIAVIVFEIEPIRKTVSRRDRPTGREVGEADALEVRELAALHDRRPRARRACAR